MANRIFDRFIDPQNFFEAWQGVRRKGSAGGLDQVSIENFSGSADRHLASLCRQIAAGTYIPTAVRAVYIPKYNDENEWRELGLPTIADKIVQTALTQIIGPILENIFLETSFAYRPGRGHRRALERVNYNLSSMNLTWVVSRDIDNFFDTLDHNRILQEFAQYLDDDPRLLELIALWCRNGVVTGDGSWRDCLGGVRQGHVIAPLLANLYLHELDLFANQNSWGWVRYSDDFLLQCSSQQETAEAYEKIELFLAETLKLKLNSTQKGIFSPNQGFTFLGVYFKGDIREIALTKMKKIERKIGWLLKPGRSVSPQKILSDLNSMVAGWRQHYSFLKPDVQFSKVDHFIQENLLLMIRERVNGGFWSEKPPAGLFLSSLEMPVSTDHEGCFLLKKLWHRAQITAPAKILETSDRKTASGRKKYYAKNICEGEILVTSPGHFIGKRGQRIVVRQGRKTISEMPIHHLKHLTLACRGLSISSDIITLCSEHGIDISFLDNRGRLTSTLRKPGSDKGELAIRQLEERNRAKGLFLARMFVWGKMKNQLAVLKATNKYKSQKRRHFHELLAKNKPFMQSQIKSVREIEGDDVDVLRRRLMGFEGVFATRYWLIFKTLIPDHLNFPGRRQRGAKDLTNALLNYGYGILYAKVLRAIRFAGLNAEIGFLHTVQNGRPTLSYDLIELFRSPVVDRTIIAMLNRNEMLQLGSDGLLNEKSRKKFAHSILKRLHSKINWHHQQLSMQAILTLQARAIRDHLVGNKQFSPFLFKW